MTIELSIAYGTGLGTCGIDQAGNPISEKIRQLREPGRNRICDQSGDLLIRTGMQGAEPNRHTNAAGLQFLIEHFQGGLTVVDEHLVKIVQLENGRDR